MVKNSRFIKIGLPLLLYAFLHACASPPLQNYPLIKTQPALLMRAEGKNYTTKSIEASEPPLPQLESVLQTPSSPDFELHFQTKQQSHHKIQIPEHGNFSLTIEAGDDYLIVDRDATDGSARITVPASQLQDIFLRIKKPFEDPECKGKGKNTPECQPDSPSASLQLTDELYMINQELKPSTGNIWHLMAHRPLPIPTDWYSSEQTKYVLNFKNKGVKGFVSRWFKHTGTPAYPLSVRVVPRLDCVWPNRTGGLVAYFSYDNKMPGDVHIPLGDYNAFQPEPSNRGQITQFHSGVSGTFPNSPVVSFIDSGQILAWTLNQRTVAVPPQETIQLCDREQISVPGDVEVRKRLVENQMVQAEAQQKSFRFTFNANLTDLKRRLILNLDSSNDLSQIGVKLNGVPQAFELVPGMKISSFELTQNLLVGENVLEIGFNQIGSTKFFLDAYMEPFEIPGAFFSRVPGAIKKARSPDYVKGVLQLKFLEGMRIRVVEDTSGFSFKDLNGTDLSRLNTALKRLGAYAFFQPLAQNKTPEELEAFEKEVEARLHTQESNRNLFFAIGVDQNLDMWAVHDEILSLPYFEEVYLRFEPAMPSVSNIPGTSTPKDAWQKITQIQNAWKLLNKTELDAGKSLHKSLWKSQFS